MKHEHLARHSLKVMWYGRNRRPQTKQSLACEAISSDCKERTCHGVYGWNIRPDTRSYHAPEDAHGPMRVLPARITHDKDGVHDTIRPRPPSLRSVHNGLRCGQFASCGITFHQRGIMIFGRMQSPIKHYLEYFLGRFHVAFYHSLVSNPEGEHPMIREHTTILQRLDGRLNKGDLGGENGVNAGSWVKVFSHSRCLGKG